MCVERVGMSVTCRILVGDIHAEEQEEKQQQDPRTGGIHSLL